MSSESTGDVSLYTRSTAGITTLYPANGTQILYDQPPFFDEYILIKLQYIIQSLELYLQSRIRFHGVDRDNFTFLSYIFYQSV